MERPRQLLFSAEGINQQFISTDDLICAAPAVRAYSRRQGFDGHRKTVSAVAALQKSRTVLDLELRPCEHPILASMSR